MLAAALGLGLLALPQGDVAPTTRPEADTLPELGMWRAWLACPGGKLPFRMRIWRQAGAFRLTVINGPERLHHDEVSVKKGILRVRLAPYDSYIQARVLDRGRRLRGEWTKAVAGGKTRRMPFWAKAGKAPRFFGQLPEGSSILAPAVAGRWAVRFAKDKHPAVGVFQVAKGEATPGAHVVHGTFLTSLGDYRFLAGECKGGYLRLSCFDGAHAFLFRAEPGRGATMNGEFWSSNTWHETWTARKDENARLPEAFQLSKWNQGTRLGDLAYPDLRGKRRSLADAAFVGPCRILQVFGTWCPNCTDASRYLAELDRRYRDRGLRVLGLAFEHAPEFENSAPLVRDYVKRQGIDYPILIAGISNKAQAQKAFPALDQVLAYPTTIFLDRRGKVRAVHTGFSGPATGAEHRRLRQRFQEIIEELLGDR